MEKLAWQGEQNMNFRLFRNKPKNWILKLISLTLATMLWYFVAGEDQVDINMLVPIEFLNLPANLTISNQYKKDLEVTVRGPRSMIQELRSRNITRPVDLAKDLIRLSGLPEDAIEIVFTVTRAGEKLYEELYFEQEELMETTHPKLHIAYHRQVTPVEVRDDIASLLPLCHGCQDVLRRRLQELIPEFTNGASAADREDVSIASS